MHPLRATLGQASCWRHWKDIRSAAMPWQRSRPSVLAGSQRSATAPLSTNDDCLIIRGGAHSVTEDGGTYDTPVSVVVPKIEEAGEGGGGGGRGRGREPPPTARPHTRGWPRSYRGGARAEAWDPRSGQAGWSLMRRSACDTNRAQQQGETPRGLKKREVPPEPHTTRDTHPLSPPPLPPNTHPHEPPTPYPLHRTWCPA
jgi:hypothetical protein